MAEPQSSGQYPFYGQEFLVKLTTRFITHLFSCSDSAPSSHPQLTLPVFIDYALHRTKLHPSVTYATLVLLLRLKGRFPSACGLPTSGHRLFITAYMISAKAMIDGTYSNHSWHIIAQHLFSPRELNQMERDMCIHLDWELTVEDPILTNFTKAVKADFGEDKSDYPNYPTTFISKRAARSEAAESISADKSDRTSLVPGFQVGNDLNNARQERNHNNINGVDTSPGLSLTENVIDAHPQKLKMFAFSAPSGW